MRILFAPDSFKGSLSAGAVCALLEEQAGLIFPGCETVSLPMADGGEGTLEILTEIAGGKRVEVPVLGPRFEPRRAEYALLPGGTALIEMAAASGLPLVPPEERNPGRTTTYGTGQLIRAALEGGCRNLIIGVGGSATNDCGMGALAALGARFLDGAGQPLEPVGDSLGAVERVDLSGLLPAAREAEVTVMCDIQNPLLGPRGATRVFGPQKGGSPAQLEALEAGMARFAHRLEEAAGISVASLPGAGAAGGLAAGLLAGLGGRLQSGIETVLELSRFRQRLAGVDLVVTGEGRVDGQSAGGKVLWGVGTACREAGVATPAPAGGLGDGAELTERCGIRCVVPVVDRPMPLEQAMEQAPALLSAAARRLFTLIRLGAGLGRECLDDPPHP